MLVALEEALRDLPDAIVRVDLHPEVMSRDDRTGGSSFENGCSQGLVTRNWQISVHPMFTDDELWAYLGSLDLCVLPYRFGTHSGWLEACVDLGTAALVPDIGYYAEQHGHPRYSLGPDGTLDKTGFVGEIRLLHQRPVAGPTCPAGPGRATQGNRRGARTASTAGRSAAAHCRSVAVCDAIPPRT